MKNFIMKGHICHSKSKTDIEIIENGYLVCKDGKSAGIYAEIPEEYKNFPIKDYSNQLVIPGLVDLHVHAPQFSYRGMLMDLELMDWLAQYTFPEEEKYADLQYARKGYEYFVEALKKGATTRVVMFATRHKEASILLMEMMEETGLVSYVGKVNMDRGATEKLNEESALAAATDTQDWIKAVKGKFERTEPIITPRFIPSCTDELMEKLGEIQAEYGLPVQSHLSESLGEIELVKSLRPQNQFYGEAYNDHGLFGSNGKTIMAHCVWSDEDEIALMQKNSVFVAHCPASNLNVASGIAPVRKYLDRDVKVGLGSDIAGGHSDSIFRAMTDAIQVSKMYWRYIDKNCAPITFPEAFYMATRGGGEFFGEVGSFEKGYEFDAVVLDDTSLMNQREATVLQRLERAAYLSLDSYGIVAKYVRGQQIIG